MKKTAVPSVNLPRSSLDCSKKVNHVSSAEREQRQIKRSFLKNELKTTNEPSDFNTDNNFQDELVLDGQIDHRHADESQPKNSVGEEDSNLQTYQVSKNEAETCAKSASEIINKQFKDVATQVRTDNFIPKFTDFISDDGELSTLTGIPNFTLLNSIKKLVDKKKQKMSHCNAKLDLLDIIIMTFMKLKQNMSYALLAVLFKCYTAETCKEKIFQMIDLLYICLKPGIYWPKKENILKNIPLDFIGFENVRAVIDCTEISIQRPKRLCCQVVTYSRYKSCYTVKFMTAVTPAGLISFISKPFGGRASDNSIFEQSGIITKFDKKDDVMTDRGFTLDEFCQKNDVKLISPPFLKDRKQFSKVEAMNGRRIAKARVHVERSNQRIKNFEILSSKMPIGLVHKVEKIFTIICAVVNLSQPILKDEKFVQDKKKVAQD